MTKQQSKRLLGLTGDLYRAILKRLRTWKLKREGRKQVASFFAVSEALGLSPYSSRQTPEQLARLNRVHAITAELRQLNFSHIKTTHRP